MSVEQAVHLVAKPGLNAAAPGAAAVDAEQSHEVGKRVLSTIIF